MDKPIDIQLLEKFYEFIKSNGYKLSVSGDYGGNVTIEITFPNGMVLTTEGGSFSSTESHYFDKAEYDNYVANAKLSGLDDPYPNPDGYWIKKEVL